VKEAAPVMRVFALPLLLSALLLNAGACARPDVTDVTVVLRIDDEVFRPDFALVSWGRSDGHELFHDVRLPDQGTLAREGAVLGSVKFEIETDQPGERELHVSGLRGNQRVAGAVARIPWQAGREQQVTLTLGCSDDLDQDDAIAACKKRDPDGAAPGPGEVVTTSAVNDAPDAAVAPQSTAFDGGAPPGRDARGSHGDAPPIEASATRDGGARTPPVDARSGDAATDQHTITAHPAPVSAEVNLTRGLLLYLRLDDDPTSLSPRDGSGWKNPTALVNVDPKNAWIDGPFSDPAIAFRAAGPPGWVRVDSGPGGATPLNEISEGFTIACWVRIAAGGGGGRRTIAARRSIGAGGFLYSLHLIGDKPGLYIHSNNGAHANLVSDQALPTETWVHLALVYDRVTAQLLVDGHTVAQQPYQLTINPENSPLGLGASADPIPTTAIDPLLGDLDEVVIYDRPLTDAEVAALATAAQPPVR
jgi:hypothetical protein